MSKQILFVVEIEPDDSVPTPDKISNVVYMVEQMKGVLSVKTSEYHYDMERSVGQIIRHMDELKIDFQKMLQPGVHDEQ